MAENAPRPTPRPQPQPIIEESTEQVPETASDTSKSNMQYPLNAEGQKSWITFTPVEYKVAPGIELGGLDTKLANFGADGLEYLQNLVKSSITNTKSNSDQGDPYADPMKYRLNLSTIGGISGLNAKRMTLPDYQIRMYLPESIIVQDGVSYAATSLKILGSAIESGIRNNKDVSNVIAEATLETIESTLAAVGTLLKGGNFNTDFAKVGLMRLAKRGPDTIRGGIQSSLGVSLNPNVRNLLESVNIRSFVFSFRCYPESPEEAETVKNIENAFREELYPESIDFEGISFGYRFPRQFLIKMYHDENPLDVFIQPCFLSNMNTTYNGGNMAWHKDGYPSVTEFTLTFTEDRALDKQAIRERKSRVPA